MFKRLYRPFEINRALKVYSETKSLRKTEAAVQISKSTIHRWFRSFGHKGIKKRSLKRTKQRTKHIQQVVVSSLHNDPFATLSHLKHKFEEPSPSISTISRTLKALKYKRRKADIKSIYCSKEVLNQKQTAFIAAMKDIDVTRVISIVDETGFLSVDKPSSGYSPSNG